MVGDSGAQEGIGHDGGCRSTGRKDGTWWVMEEDSRDGWDTVGDRSIRRRDGMGWDG